MTKELQSTETLRELRVLYAGHPEANLLRNIIRCLADPVQPVTKTGGFRPHPVLVWIGVIGVVAAASFLYFSYIQP
jgi:hypothetical protein